MRIFIYEFVTGGGWYHVDPLNAPSGSLLAEGRAMASAICEDFAHIDGVQVTRLWDERLPGDPETLRVESLPVCSVEESNYRIETCIQEADAVLLIAPELQGELLQLARLVERAGKRLLSPTTAFIEIASDKAKLDHELRFVPATGMSFPSLPKTMRAKSCDHAPSDLRFPLITKPIDGCGSLHVRLIRTAAEWSKWCNGPTDFLVQEYCEGLPVSISSLHGPRGLQFLPPCLQVLSNDERFNYLGGKCPLTPNLVERCERQAGSALSILSNAGRGFVGCDIILGEEEDGSQDYLIEINPRLTTSYVGLRVLSETNLAQAMLDAALGKTPDLRWKPGTVSWSASGEVTYQP